MNLAHLIELDPTYGQANAFARAAGCARFAYNWGLREWDRLYQAGEKPTAHGVKKLFNAIKRQEFPWILESPKDANQQAFGDLGRAYSNFFASITGKRKGRKIGHPKPRRKGPDDAFYVSNDRFEVKERGVRLPIIGFVRTKEALRLKGRILGARISRTADRWFLAVQVDVGDVKRSQAAVTRPVLGVDLGLKTAAYFSSGESEDAPKPLKKNLARLRLANRRLHRRQKGSRNRRQAAIQVARIHQRAANVRKDFMHKLTTRLLHENQVIVIEDLNVRGMLRNEKLARAISDVGFGMFRRFLEYKAPMFGAEIVVADRWFPSSKRCHLCGVVKPELGLGERIYSCEGCGQSCDRDWNASMNLEMYPRLAGNKTPMETVPLCERENVHVSTVAEVGTKPCAHVHTS